MAGECQYPGDERCGRIHTYQNGCRGDDCRTTATEMRRRYRDGYDPNQETNRLIEALKPAGPWVVRAACRGADIDLFFPSLGEKAEPAKAICATCPVTEQCLQLALDNGEKFGVWGGLSESQRRKLRRAA